MILTACVAAGLAAKLATIQISPSARLLDIAGNQSIHSAKVRATRGAIVDRLNRDMALSGTAKTVVLNPQSVVDIAKTALDLSGLFAVLTADLEARITAARANKSQFMYIARRVDDAKAAEALGLGLPGLTVIEEPQRVHPGGDAVGASVLGTTDIDNKGVSGLESEYDEAGE